MAISKELLELLVCPACKKELTRGAERYCPKCGAERVRRDNRPLSGQCESCGADFMSGEGRPSGVRCPSLFKIRACAYCGFLLDEKGVIDI